MCFSKVWFKEQGLLEGVVAPLLALNKIEIEEQGLVGGLLALLKIQISPLQLYTCLWVCLCARL